MQPLRPQISRITSLLYLLQSNIYLASDDDLGERWYCFWNQPSSLFAFHKFLQQHQKYCILTEKKKKSSKNEQKCCSVMIRVICIGRKWKNIFNLCSFYSNTSHALDLSQQIFLVSLKPFGILSENWITEDLYSRENISKEVQVTWNTGIPFLEPSVMCPEGSDTWSGRRQQEDQSHIYILYPSTWQRKLV